MFKKKHPEIGAKPGSLVFSHESPLPRIEVVDYGPETHEVVGCDSPETCARFLETRTVSWIDVQGLGDHAVLEKMAEVFHIHPLALEDAVNVPLRPKSELYENYHLIVLQMVQPGEGGHFQRSQVTLFVGARVLITIQETHGDVFDPVRRRTKVGPRMRERGTDYLAYALIDLVVDGYYPLLEPLGEQIQKLEDEITLNVKSSQVARVLDLRHRLQELRRDVIPIRELTSDLLRQESPFFSESTHTYLRDCYDHALQISEVIDGYMEQTSQLISLHSAMMGNRMNEIMKVLTIMSTIFIPLGFLAGLYGMNFEYMPELDYRYAYFVLLGVMFTVAVVLLVLFRRRGWLGEDD